MTMFEKPLRMQQYEHFVLEGIQEDIRPRDIMLLGALGLAGESGGVVDLIKKQMLHADLHVARERVVEELGDTLWYFTLIMLANNISFEEVMFKNMVKLVSRYPDRHPDLACLWENEPTPPKKGPTVEGLVMGDDGKPLTIDDEPVKLR